MFRITSSKRKFPQFFKTVKNSNDGKEFRMFRERNNEKSNLRRRNSIDWGLLITKRGMEKRFREELGGLISIH